jgi:hypothetical protein
MLLILSMKTGDFQIAAVHACPGWCGNTTGLNSDGRTRPRGKERWPSSTSLDRPTFYKEPASQNQAQWVLFFNLSAASTSPVNPAAALALTSPGQFNPIHLSCTSSPKR